MHLWSQDIVKNKYNTIPHITLKMSRDRDSEVTCFLLQLHLNHHLFLMVSRRVSRQIGSSFILDDQRVVEVFLLIIPQIEKYTGYQIFAKLQTSLPEGGGIDAAASSCWHCQAIYR